VFAASGRWIFGCSWFLIILTVYSFFGEGGFGQIKILQLIFSPFSMTFLLGYFIGLLCNQIRKAPLSLALMFFVVGVGSMAFGLIVPWPCPLGIYPNNNHFFRFVACGFPAALLVASVIALEPRLPKLILRLDFLGDISYATYLIHLPFVTGFYIILSKLHLNSPVLIAVAAIVCLVSCLMISAVFHYCLELKITRKCREILENHFQLQK
jgi:peptidoglycan/LPS O-acetylase OafA/YrhL